MSKVFITGGTGCIGATAIHQILQSDKIERILVASRSSNTDLLKMWQGPELDPRIELVSLDIGDQDATQKAIADFAPTHIVHLGALQSPACDANPQLGMEINVGGTINLFDSAAALDGLERFVFASSAAVYGKRAIYDTPTVAETATLAPPNLYGVWKVAGEHLAALFHEKTGVPTVSLRLNTTYGPGRDQGKTSAPTNALKAIAAGAASGTCIPNRMPYQGRENYHYVEDVGAHFAAVTTMPFEGIGAFNIRGRTIPVSEFLDIAKSVATEIGYVDACDLGIQDNAAPNLFVCDLCDKSVAAAFPGVPRTDIADGIRKSLETFVAQAKDGKLNFNPS